MLIPLANGKIKGLFNAFECFSSTFQDSPVYSSTFQACENPEVGGVGGLGKDLYVMHLSTHI